jgi:hypothetical protein
VTNAEALPEPPYAREVARRKIEQAGFEFRGSALSALEKTTALLSAVRRDILNPALIHVL